MKTTKKTQPTITTEPTQQGPLKNLLEALEAIDEAVRQAREKAKQEAAPAEQEFARVMKRLSAKYPVDVVSQAANVTWWDHFGGRKASDPWKNLDAYMEAWKPSMSPDPKQVQRCLIEIGYTPAKAAARYPAGE